MRKNSKAAVALLAAVILAGCAKPAPQTLRTGVAPGTAVIRFNAGRNAATEILADPRVHVGAVAAQALEIAASQRGRRHPLFVIDDNGVIGLPGRVRAMGGFQVISSRAFKANISPFSTSGEALLGELKIRRFHYRDEPPGAAWHLGIIAEDAPSLLAGHSHTHADLTNELALILKADAELYRQERLLDRRIAFLKRELAEARQLRAARGTAVGRLEGRHRYKTGRNP